MSPDDLKPIPTFDTAEEFDAWFDTADLSKYDFVTGFKPAQFVLKAKDARVNMRLPESQLRAVKAAASYEGMPYQRFIRKAIDEALEKSFREAGRQQAARETAKKKAS